jgi:predicted DsbA family dithiol-disulfide isomerase
MTGRIGLNPRADRDSVPMTEPIRIDYFSDVLCVWAYIAQIRLDELKSTFGDRVSIDFHFTPVFGDAHHKLATRWRDRGGFTGYSNHVREVAAKFDHIAIHPDLWTQNIPHSSTSCHLFLRAIKLLEDTGAIASKNNTSTFEMATRTFREAFFTQAANISDRQIQLELAKKLKLPVTKIKAFIDSGEAYAQLSRDFDLVKEHNVTVSPTLIFNEGRQRLNGNVGYRVIEANIRELLHNPPNEQSWC